MTLGSDFDSVPAWSQRAGETPAVPWVDALASQNRYVARELLGRGGMGEVLLARDTFLGRDVALKRALDVAGLQRLLAEANLAALLEHPGIVPIYDAVTLPDGSAFYVMRLVRGRTLAQALADQRVQGLSGRIRLVPQLLDAVRAVAFAHRIGILHRDLKPDNVLVGEFGDTQVADWGLAVRVDQAPIATAIQGCPAYLSPQRAKGLAATTQDDCFALGAILYEILSGQAPFAAASAEAQLERAQIGAIAPLDPTAPPELAAIALRATAFEPRDRYADLAAFAADLEAWQAGRRVNAHRYTQFELAQRFVSAFRLPLAVGGLALAALAAVVTIGVKRVAAERDRAVAAQQREEAALGEASKQLIETLAVQAQAAATRGERADAERLAARSLAQGPQPVARGVFAAFALQDRPQYLGLPRQWPCAAPHLDPTGEVAVCLEAEAARWTIGHRAAEVQGVFRDAALFATGPVALATETTLTLADANGKVLGRLNFDRAWPLTAAFSQPFFAVKQPMQASLVDASALRVVAQAVCPDRRIALVTALSERGDLLALACEDNHLVLARPGAPTLALNAPFVNEMRGVAAMALLSPGLLAAVGIDGTLVTIQLPSGALTRLGPVQVGEITAIWPDNDHQRVAVLGVVGGVSWRRLSDGAELGRAPTAGVRNLAGDLHGQRLVTFGISAVAWRPPQGNQPVVLGGGAGLAAVDASPDGRWLAAGAGGGDVLLWPLPTGEPVQRRPTCAQAVKDVRFDAAGHLLVACAGAPVPQASGGATVEPALTLTTNARRAGWSRDGSTWTVDTTGSLRVAAVGKPLQIHKGPGFVDADSKRDGTLAVVVGPGGDIWSLAPDQPARVTWAGANAQLVALPANGSLVAVASTDTLKILEHGQVRQFAAPGAAPQDLATDANAVWLAVARMDGSVSLYRTRDGALLATLLGHRQRAAAVTFSPDGAVLASASWDGTVHLWSLRAVLADPAVLSGDVDAAWK